MLGKPVGRAGSRLIRVFSLAVLWGAITTPILAGGLTGIQGSRLRGSISCIHPNLIFDLLDRIGDEQDYTTVARIYIEQGYCLEADIMTILKKSLWSEPFQSWDGHQAEAWETVLVLARADGTREEISSFSIVFPMEMEITYSQ
ncbi:hypothetical protein [Reyranella sp.]|jgi:hypothetical protein|uniref:hypothetical protein n=1 Tax=Reyranella sp. TaxID=1929291 RepID=UPI000BCC5524|nr:hypothetical protein [Reyranella sp.]OYY42352.1 MAG: hypothetical protein B7Y57_12140 [Rhodospirillales bacterium 35-66-84]OYZ94038.1 MAG: hypothetical protein B7Y08_14785 [Rhodospirillales bacterium 24-66-33]OZB22313.1 MAG: hypothetical protein B7X63_23055 [Rhodospirillales bacterium 39-66-50]HQS17571.1 hypothetical protein [Reyranella sp.]HQT14300.1 hypothetical protein [Reyranella sp.]